MILRVVVKIKQLTELFWESKSITLKIYPFKALYPKLELINSIDQFFATAKRDFSNYQEAGFYEQITEESLFICQIASGDHRYIGIIACNDIKDLQDQKIIKHENTLAFKEQDTLQRMLNRNALIKPVLLGYDADKSIDKYCKKIIDKKEALLTIPFEESDEKITLWKIDSPKKLNKLQSLFQSKIKQAYIADGHHRCFTILHLHENKNHQKDIDQLLVIYIPFDQLRVLDFNRIVELPKGMSTVQLIAQLTKWCKIKKLKKPRRPKNKHRFVLSVDQEWYQLTWKKKVLEKFSEKNLPLLDVDILNQLIFKKIFKIDDPKTDTRITYLSGDSTLKDIEKQLEKTPSVGFFLYPVKTEELKQISDAGLIMPPKSTWFEPRIKNGVIVKPL
jgi:uncharacterized protein (DUF1015 family)